MPRIEFDEEKHIYTVNGEQVPSVTSVVDSITGGYGDVPQAVIQQAARRGTAVHEMLEGIDYGIMPEEVPGDLVGYVRSYMDFLRDYKPMWTGIEKVVYNANEGYIGTLDRCGEIDGRTVIVDLKTVASPTKKQYIGVCCQTEAYSYAEYNGKAYCYALYLKPNGEYRLFSCDEFQSKMGFDAFSLFREALQTKKKVERILKCRTK